MTKAHHQRPAADNALAQRSQAAGAARNHRAGRVWRWPVRCEQRCLL